MLCSFFPFYSVFNQLFSYFLQVRQNATEPLNAVSFDKCSVAFCFTCKQYEKRWVTTAKKWKKLQNIEKNCIFQKNVSSLKYLGVLIFCLTAVALHPEFLLICQFSSDAVKSFIPRLGLNHDIVSLNEDHGYLIVHSGSIFAQGILPCFAIF